MANQTKIFLTDEAAPSLIEEIVADATLDACSGLPQMTEQPQLIVDGAGVKLCWQAGKKAQFINVDFCAGGQAHRRKFGGGKGQSIAKAVGLNKGVYPYVLDATAGLGGDSFVLATLGCRVDMVERSPVAYWLLKDGLSRAESYASSDDPELRDIVDRMRLHKGSAHQYLASLEKDSVDVVYLDPMFPERKKSAAVKKEMQAFHQVIGADEDSDMLLGLAMEVAKYRVVVKRSKIAPYLSAEAPSYQLIGKSSRFDIYTKRSLAP